MRIIVLHRKKDRRNVANEMLVADEVWVVGRITPSMRSAIEFAELVRIPVFFSPLKQETEDRLFGK